MLLLVLIVLLNSVRKVYQKKQEAEKALVHMQAEVATLKKREQFLKDSIANIQTKEGLEFEIRKKLNVAQAGESVAVIVEEEIASSTASVKNSVWQTLKTFFSNIFR